MKRMFRTAAFAVAGSAGVAFAQTSYDSLEREACAELGEIIEQFDNPDVLDIELRRNVDAQDHDACLVVLEDIDASGGLQGYAVEGADTAESDEVGTTPYVAAAQGEPMPKDGKVTR